MYFLTSFINKLQRSSLADTSEQLFLGRQWESMAWLEKLAIVLIALSPALYLGVKHWITNLSILAVLVVVYHLIQVRAKLKQIPYIRGIALVFIIYTAAIMISQLGRLSFTYKPYLEQSRWVIGLPIFVFLYYVRINFAKILDWAAPICVFTAFVSSVYLYPADANAWGGRATVSFMDPLAFGFMNLSVGLMCFASVAVDMYKKNYTINTVVKFLAFVLGVYLSIRSGSRSGWAAFPVVIFLVFYILYRPRFWQSMMFILFTSTVMVVLYQTNSVIKARVDLFAFELLQYPWFGGMAQDTSVGLRVTFYRLGYYYFSQSPLFGWGERGYGEIKDAAELLSFSTQYARDFAFSALFHSEWVTQAVRFGIFGLLGVFWVFWLPMRLFANFLKLGSDYLKVACMGFSYILCLLAASFSDEVFNYKGMITFSAIIIAGLLATGLSLRGRVNQK